MKAIAEGRILILFHAVIFIGITIYCAAQGKRRNADFYQWLEARPMETVIDLSQPGEISVPFQQTCSVSHGEALYLMCDLDDANKENLEPLFEGLSASIVIKNDAGNEIQNVSINHETVQRHDNQILLAWLSSFPQGAYTATIRVDSGASALAGKHQEVYAKYQLCGLELLPALIMNVFAFGAGTVGLVLTLCCLPGLVRQGIWRDVPEKAPD